MKRKWGTGFKLALAALGVIVVSTALKQFISYNRTPGKDALFTIGAALLLGFGAKAFGATGVAGMALTSGLVVAGVEFVGGQASNIGNSLAGSFRGITGQGAAPSGAPSSSSYFSYDQGGGVPLGMGLTPAQGGYMSAPVPAAAAPAPAAPQSITYVQQAAKPPSDLAVIAQSALGAVGSFFQGGFGKIVGGSAGVSDFNWTLGSGSDQLARMRALVA